MPTEGSSEIRCGVDEAGRGCLAGAIYAAAVVLDPERPIDGLADSKSISAKERARLEREIKEKARAFGVAWATVCEIDTRGIEWANRIAFTRAVRALFQNAFDVDRRRMLVQIDGNRRAWRLGLPQMLVVGGDALIPAISAASILAKTARDRYVLKRLHPVYPQYGFDRHKGYATRVHFEAIATWGPTPCHRVSFNLHRAREAPRAVVREYKRLG